MPRTKGTEPCLEAHCERPGNDSYGLCNTHARAWKRANADKRCDHDGCTNYLYRPGKSQPASRLAVFDGVTYRRCNEHMHTFLRWTAEVEHYNITRFARSITPSQTGCWEFQSNYVSNPKYGGFSPEGSNAADWLAHRVSYGLFIGGFGRDHQLDHRCMNPRCVRPDHLQAVTPKMNTQRRSAGKPMRPYLKNRTEAALQFAAQFNLPIK